MWRSGRIGGAAASVTIGNGRFREARDGTRSRGGNRLPLGDQDLLQRDRRLGREADVVRHPGLASPNRVIRPVLREVQPIRHRQAGRPVGHRQRHRHLATSPPPGNCPACRAGRNTVASPPPSAAPSWETRCRRRSTPRSGRCARSTAAPVRVPAPEPARPTMARSPPSAAATGADTAPAVTAASGSTLLRPRHQQPQAVVPQRYRGSAWPITPTTPSIYAENRSSLASLRWSV